MDDKGRQERQHVTEAQVAEALSACGGVGAWGGVRKHKCAALVLSMLSLL